MFRREPCFYLSRWLCVLVTCLTTQSAVAHPVPKRAHDRTVVVRLTPEAVVVDYRLEVDEWTVVFIDLPAVNDRVDLAKLTRPAEFHEAFTRCYAPILADNLLGRLDGQPLTFHCVERSHRVIDHLQCDFRFEAPCKLDPAARHEFSFREGNYEMESGMIRLALPDAAAVKFISKTEPDEVIKARPLTERKPGDEEKLRNASARFEFRSALEQESAVLEAPGKTGLESTSQLDELFNSQRGVLILMAMAAFWGAAHALTPGHGKTLVAAYLVGEHGTIWHALILGLVVTLTHTGVVIVVAALLPHLFPEAAPADVQTVLGTLSGLLVAGLGIWLLLCRLSGRADHFHLPGHGHHHHDHGHSHEGADHFHDEHGHAHLRSAAGEDMGWKRLILLGVSGGIIPCWEAIMLLVYSMKRLELGLPLVLAFSVGLASVLVGIGIVVVSAKDYAGRLGSGRQTRRLFQALPILSAVLVTGMGLWLCYGSLHSTETPPPTAVARP